MNNRKILQELANKMGLIDEAVLTVQENPVTKKISYQLVNNHRRFVKGILRLSRAEQDARIEKLQKIVDEVETSNQQKTEENKE